MGTTDGLSRQGVASAEQTHPILLALTAGPSPEGGAAFLEEVRSACGEDHFHQAPVPETAPVSPHVVLLVLERPCAQQVDRVRQALPQTPVVLVLPATGEPADWLQATHDVGAHDFLSVADRDPRLICRVVHSARTHLHNETTRRRHQILLDKSPDGFWINDLEGQIREVNPAFAAMVGYSPAELTGMRINDLELEEDAEATRHHIQVILDRGSDRFATRHRHKDGGVVHLDVSAHFVEEGPGRVMAVFRDISSEKEARVAKERLTERLRLATSAAGLGIWDLDLESGYLEWDAGMFRIYGVAETDFS
ncbi:MAG TPA: PAS domain S-box protein, partial [Gammaproteobacteria bacterium]|nr:PAS domain S-box protein [Gammaproteobacteria bacterium]